MLQVVTRLSCARQSQTSQQINSESRLRKLANGRRTELRVAMRARVVLAAARGLENQAIAEDLDINRETVARWRSRCAECGVESIMKDYPREGRKPSARSKVESEIIRMTTQEKPVVSGLPKIARPAQHLLQQVALSSTCALTVSMVSAESG